MTRTHAGWLRRKGRRWRMVCEGPGWRECWLALLYLDREGLGPSLELTVLPLGSDPRR